MLEEVSLQCPSLERLDFTYCQGLPDDALARLPAGAPRLSSLVLSVCTSVGTPGLYHLKELFRLRMLDLSYTDIQVSCLSSFHFGGFRLLSEKHV